ncbi:MAG: TonB-dependent receptor [Bacteroidetes bacterium]|nr:TonB-dependent receptor [Bacteroidota bacterium]
MVTLYRKSVVFIFLLFLSGSLFAQKGVVKGVIADRETNQPIEFTSVVVLKQSDSSVVGGKLTGKKGDYLIASLDVGNYLIKVVSIGYENYLQSFSITESIRELKFDSIFLKVSRKQLDDVVVQGTRSKISNKLDKQIYKAGQFEAAKGGNATDVLKNLPSVSVNASGEIFVRGATGFLVLINGKPVLTDPQTVLSQLPANTIENIEIITAPSAKYDADGKSGIINITTIKGSSNGSSTQFNLLGGLPSTTDYDNLEKPLRFGADITYNYKKDRWDITLSGNFTRNDANGRREGDVFTKNQSDNIITYFPSLGERSFDRYNFGGRTVITYNPGKNDVISVGLVAGKKYQQRRADIVYNNTVRNLTTGALIRTFNYFNSNLQNREGVFTLGSIDYIHIFKNKSKINASFIYEYANLYGNTFNTNTDFPQKRAVFQYVTNPYSNPIDGYRIKFDYSIPFGKHKLETGYQYRWDNQEGNFEYNVTPITNQPDIEKFRGFACSTNQIHGLFTELSGKLGTIQYNTGLRFESAKRSVRLSYDENINKLNLDNLFPSLNLLYPLNSAWNLKAGYSKRVQRNKNYELNPIPEREHSETLEQGDPNLLPQFIDLAELGINNQFPNGSFFTTLYFQNIKHPIQRVNSVYADTILNRVFTSTDNARLIGFEIGSNFKPTKWFTAYAGANIYNYKIGGTLNVLGSVSEVANTNWVYSFNINTAFDLGKQWNLQANLNYLSARPTAQGEDSRFFNPNISVKKIFNNGRYTLGFQWQNINLGRLNANEQRISTSGRDFYTTTNYIQETDVLLINFTINLNKLNNKIKLPSSEIGEKEF